MHESVTIIIECPRCAASAAQTFAQRQRFEEVHSSTSTSCDTCGLATEANRIDLPFEVRETFYAQHGKWDLVLAAAPVSKAALLRVVATLEGTTLSEASERLRMLPVTLFTGTTTEIEALAAVLEGVNAVVARTRAA